jgi:hypothetical protein
MTHKISLGDVVATRELDFTHGDGRIESVTVSIGKPVCVDSSQLEWWCPYLIRAKSFEKQFRIVGGDSMQALILGTQILSAELYALARDNKGSFSYLGGKDLHFPE